MTKWHSFANELQFKSFIPAGSVHFSTAQGARYRGVFTAGNKNVVKYIKNTCSSDCINYVPKSQQVQTF